MQEIRFSCLEETADPFANVCTGMFLRVGAVSSECRGHPRGSEFRSYVSAIEGPLLYAERTVGQCLQREVWVARAGNVFNSDADKDLNDL